MHFHLCSLVCADDTPHSHTLSHWQSIGNFSYTQPHLCSNTRTHRHTKPIKHPSNSVPLANGTFSYLWSYRQKGLLLLWVRHKEQQHLKTLSNGDMEKPDRRKINGNICQLQACWNSKRAPLRYKADFKMMKNPVFSVQQKLAPKPMNLWDRCHGLFRTLRGKDGELFDMSAFEWNIYMRNVPLEEHKQDSRRINKPWRHYLVFHSSYACSSRAESLTDSSEESSPAVLVTGNQIQAVIHSLS